MKCPNCNNEVVDYLDFCYVCDYLFDSYFEKLYVDITGKFICSIIIEETINNYFNTPIKSYKTRHIDSKIIFKNISTDNIFQTFPTNLSPEEFTINFYKQKGYNAFFAENNYWIILFSMIYDYKNFISYPHYFELISRNLHDTDIDKIDFNSIKNIHIASRIIKAYFKSICPIIPPHEMYNHENYSSGLRDNYTVTELIAANSYLTEKQLLLIFERMGDDFKYYSYGFPDLIVYNDNEFFFVEVKLKNDKPSFKQIQWHKFLAEVVGIDVVLFMINQSDEIHDIKKMYDVELFDSKKRKYLIKDINKKSSLINWNDDNLKQHMAHVRNDDFNNLIYLRRNYMLRYKKYIVNDYAHLSPDDFEDFDEWNRYREASWIKRNDFIFEKAKELYYSHSFEDYRPTQKQLERNKKAKLFEDNGEYFKAVDLYMENVIERTGSPVTYKRLVYILNKFDRFDDVIQLMDIAIPIFIALNDKTNSLRFIAQKFAAMNENKSVSSMEIKSSDNLKSKQKKNTSKQTDLSSYFN